MGFNEYEKFDAIGLAGLIKKKEVSPLEVMESCIDRINEHNPNCLLYTSPSPRDRTRSRMPSSA